MARLALPRVVLARVDDLVGDACARHEFVLLVVDFDVVARGGAAEVCWGAHAADATGDSCTVVGDVEVNTYRDFPLEAGVEDVKRGRERAEGFRECRAGSAVEDSGNLGVGFNGHGCSEFIDCEFLEYDSELRHELAWAVMSQVLPDHSRDVRLGQFGRERVV